MTEFNYAMREINASESPTSGSKVYENSLLPTVDQFHPPGM